MNGWRTSRGVTRRDETLGQRHTRAEDIRMVALGALLPEKLERHCQSKRSRLDTYQKVREEVVLYAEARGYVAPKLGQVSKVERTEIILWMLADSDNGRDDPLPKERGRTPLARWKEQERTVRSLQDNRTRQRFMVSVGSAGQQVVKRKATAATQPRTIKFFWKRKRRESQAWQRWKERQIQKCWSTCLESAD